MRTLLGSGRTYGPALAAIPWLWAAAFLALRFFFPGDTVYIYDESLFQLRIDEHRAAGTFPWVSFFGSSLPIPYGGGGLWFYYFLRLFTWHPVAIVLCHISLQVAAACLLISVLRRAYGREAAGWAALLIATSPLLFFFARQPWDNTLLMPLGALIVFLVERLPRSSSHIGGSLLLGIVVGYGLNIHLMFGPVALATGLTLLLCGARRWGWRSPKTWLPALLFGLTAFAMLVPYLLEARRLVLEQGAPSAALPPRPKHWGDGRNLWWTFQRTALFSSLFGADVYLRSVREDFAAFTGPWLAKLFRVDLFGWPAKLVAWSAAVATLARLLRGKISQDPLLLLSATAFFFTLLVLQYLNIPTAPHYFNPVWWFVFVGVAAALPRLSPRWKGALALSIGATALVNSAYVAEALAFLRVNRGARNMEASVVVAEQMRMMRELCAWGGGRGRPEVRLYREAFVAAPPFAFLPAHMPECRGVRLTIVPGMAEADFVLRHPRDSTASAALVADPVPAP